MNTFKRIGGKFLKGAVTGAVVAFGTLTLTGSMDKHTLTAAGLSMLSGAIHGGWEAVFGKPA